MESNEQDGNSQENDKGSKQNNENSNKTDQNDANVLVEQQATLVQPSTSSNENKKSPSLAKLTERTNNIIKKLATKREQLQLQTNRVESNKDALKENDMKVLKALHAMGKKSLHTQVKAPLLPNGTLPNGVTKPNRAIAKVDTVKPLQQHDQSLLTKENAPLPNGILPNGVTKSNGATAKVDTVKPLQHHTKKQLESLVEGLHELVRKLTLNDNNLKSKAEQMAHQISGLQDFPIFSNSELNGPSTSAAGRKRNDSRRDSEKAISKKISKEQESKRRNKKEKEKVTPADIFAKYINDILTQYFGEEQKDKLEKYKCLASHIEDLESYATTLVQAGFGRIVESEIRINRKNNRQSFITMSTDRNSKEKDGMILMPVARRYAFEGDIVRAFVLNQVTTNNNTTATEEGSLSNRKMRKISSHITGGNNSLSLAEDEVLFDEEEADSSPDSDNEEITDVLDTSMAMVTENSRKAFVIRIVKQTELREIVGTIGFVNTTVFNTNYYFKLKPHDMRVPMVYIPQDMCMDEMAATSAEDVIRDNLYVARVLETDINGHCIGELVQPVGKVGDLQAEIKAILLHNGLRDIKPYEQKFLDMYKGPMPIPSEEDLKHREDLRKKCVFTIDPLTAKDLDDAVSVEKLNDQEYEIGVHISDVSYYLEENSELDEIVKYRATSIYLVNEVIHMLPPSLCFRCSLLPGEDKFAFSVFWKWNSETQEFSAPRFTRSIINSCSQFAYEHAQKIIDNPTEEFDIDDFPDLLNEWTPNDIKWRVLLLQQIAQQLKAKRYENGALTINNPKLRFQMDPKTGEPIAYEIEGRKEANFLIEEFMLLANQSVAKFIHDHFPDTSILRNHSPPLQKSMKALKERLNNMGLEFDISSSKAIHESMQRLTQQASDPNAVDTCLSALLTKPMARATYFCSEGKTEEADLRHYALSIPIYTHFTSPIRRYPDILVHRLLAASLNYCPPPQRTTDELHHLAKICNDQKFNAKNAGDESIELFFTRYVKAKQSITLKAVVTEISKHTLNVVTIETGHTIPITYKLQKVLVDTTNVPNSICITEKNSQIPPLKLQLFSTLDINLVLRNDKICGFFASPDIKQRRENSKESSKREKLSNNNLQALRHRQQSDSISEQEEDITQQTSSSKSRKRDKFKIKKKKENGRLYALANDK